MAVHRRSADDRLSVNSVGSVSSSTSQHSFLTRQRMAHIRRQPGGSISPAQVPQSTAQRWRSQSPARNDYVFRQLVLLTVSVHRAACFLGTVTVAVLTLSLWIPLGIYTLSYWSNPPFLISDIRALWRSGLSARVPECQKLKTVG